jgi:hypothetical protein
MGVVISRARVWIAGGYLMGCGCGKRGRSTAYAARAIMRADLPRAIRGVKAVVKSSVRDVDRLRQAALQRMNRRAERP